jgi:uncharacterized protein YjbI with pentapeptide repeats
MANLADAWLSGANLADAWLDLANLTGARLDGVEGLVPRQLDSASEDGQTVLPEGMARLASWQEPDAS